jgi:copper chaperone CopZ
MAWWLAIAASPALAAEQTVTLVLGGKLCDLDRSSVEAALKQVPGVTGLDLKSVKGSVVVRADAPVKPETLEAAVNGVKGDGGSCKTAVRK